MVKLEEAKPSEKLINTCLYGKYGKPLVSPDAPIEPEMFKPNATPAQQDEYWKKKQRWYADLKRWERELEPYYRNEPLVTFDDERAKACQQLALMCKEKMDKELDEDGKEQFRKSLIDEIKISHSPTGQYVDVLGTKTEIYKRDSTILDEGFDTEAYVAQKKKEPFGFCALSLYGMETQFFDQMKYPLQDLTHAHVANNVDALVFGKEVKVGEIEEDPRSVHNRAIKWLNSPGNEVDKRLVLKDVGILDVDNEAMLKGITVDKYLTHLNDYLQTSTVAKAIDTVISRGIVEPEPQISLQYNKSQPLEYIKGTSEGKGATKCDDLYLNPIFGKGKYKYCTEVNLRGDQHAVIYKAMVTERGIGFKKDWIEINKPNSKTKELSFMWDRLNPTLKKEIMKKFGVDKPVNTPYDNFDPRELPSIIKAWVSLEDRTTPTEGLSEAEKLNVIHKKQLDNVDNSERISFVTGDDMRQECYHLFWNLIFHHDVVSSYLEAIKEAKERGDLTDADYATTINALMAEEVTLRELKVLFDKKDMSFTDYMREKKELEKREATLAKIAKKVGRQLPRGEELNQIQSLPGAMPSGKRGGGVTPKVTYMPVRDRVYLSQANMDLLLQYYTLFHSIQGLSRAIVRPEEGRENLREVLSGGDPAFYDLYHRTFSPEEWTKLKAPKSADIVEKGSPEDYLNEEED